MAWETINLIGAKITQIDAAKVFPLGKCCEARDDSSGISGEFMYVQGVASAALGQWAAIYPTAWTTALLADAYRGPVGLFMSALVASTFGWVQIRGPGVGMLDASVADNAALHATTTAGQAGATGSGLTEIMCAVAAAASGSSAANTVVELYYPICTSVEPA